MKETDTGEADVRLECVLEECEAYSAKAGLPLLFCKGPPETPGFALFEWDNSKGSWKGFFDSMRTAGARYMAAYAQSLDEEDVKLSLQALERTLEDPELQDMQDEIRKDINDLREASRHPDEIGAVNLLAVVDGARWLCRVTAPWFDRWEEIEECYGASEEEPEEASEQEKVECGVCAKSFEGRPGQSVCPPCVAEALKTVKTQEPEALGKQVADAAIEELGGPDLRNDLSMTFWRDYWQARGVRRYGLTGQVSKRFTRAERAFVHLLRQLTAELRDRLSTCLAEWARSQGKKKVSEADTDLFINENGADVRSESKQLIRAKANQLLVTS